MNNPDNDFSNLTEINRMVHEPARLAILAVLAGCESADFQFLLAATGLTKGNLSAQAIKLEEAGYLTVEKGFRGRTPYTLYTLASAGRQALDAYRERMRQALGKI